MWCDAIYTPQNMKGGNILPEEVKQFLDEEMIGGCDGQDLEWWLHSLTVCCCVVCGGDRLARFSSRGGLPRRSNGESAGN